LIREYLLGEIDDAKAVARSEKLDKAAITVATAAWQKAIIPPLRDQN
jgi:hypothetical protein